MALHGSGFRFSRPSRSGSSYAVTNFCININNDGENKKKKKKRVRIDRRLENHLFNNRRNRTAAKTFKSRCVENEIARTDNTLENRSRAPSVRSTRRLRRQIRRDTRRRRRRVAVFRFSNSYSNPAHSSVVFSSRFFSHANPAIR